EMRAPELPFISTVSGQLWPQDTVLDAAYWRRHCREPVRFLEGLTALGARRTGCGVEIGPGSVLATLSKRLQPSAAWLPSLMPQHQDWQVLSASLAGAYTHGADIDWSGFDAPFPRNRMPLPTYAFQRKRHWLGERERTMHTEQPAGT